MLIGVLTVVFVVVVAAGSRRLDRVRVDHDAVVRELRASHQLDMRRLRDAQDRHIQALMTVRNPDLEQMVALVDRLCQRVQAPEQAIVDHHYRDVMVPGPQPVSPELDDEFFETKEDLAERMAVLERAA